MNFVSVKDMSGNDIAEVYAISVSDTRSAEIIGSPVENGSIRFDGKVFSPRRVTIVGMIHADGFEKANAALTELYLNRTYKFSRVVTKMEEIDDLALERYKRDEDNDKLDLVGVTLEFKQIMFTSKSDVTGDDAMQSTKNAGRKNFT